MSKEMKALNKLAKELGYNFMYSYDEYCDKWVIYERSLHNRVFSDVKSLANELYLLCDDLSIGMKAMIQLVEEKETTVIDL